MGAASESMGLSKRTQVILYVVGEQGVGDNAPDWD